MKLSAHPVQRRARYDNRFGSGIRPQARSNGVTHPYGSTLKGRLLESVPPGVTTCTVPVVAPLGTVVLMDIGIRL
jgi:hypothetical protein